MNSYRDRGVTCTSSDLLDGGGGGLLQQTPFRHTTNGHPAPGLTDSAIKPRMGVRARIAEWPPRRAQSRESLLENGQIGSSRHIDDGSTSISRLSSDMGLVRGGVARLPRRRSKDVEFRGGGFGGERGSPFSLRVFPPLRQRSNSEVTLSEQDENEVEVRGSGGMGNLFREYGSTSSIDIQGIPEQSFFDMLSQFHQERPDQRSSAPIRLGELLRAPDSSAPLPSAPSPGPAGGDDRGTGRKDGAERVRKKSGGTESSLGTSSLFRKLRSSSRSELDGGKGETSEDGGGRGSGDASYKPWVCPKSFVHYDAQSILFDLHEAAAQRGYAAQRRNTATGASAASVSLSVSRSTAPSVNDPVYSSIEDLTLSLDPGSTTPSLGVDPLDGPPGAHNSSPLLLCCPHFLNETGGHGERNISFLSSSAERGGDRGDGARGWLRRSNASVSVLEVPIEEQVTRLDRLKLYSIEHVDLGARYYREYFHGKEHSNYFGTDEKMGAVALSIRREKLEDTKDLKDQYQYRLIVRTSELVTLRGSILEDAVASTGRHGTVRGLPLKEVLEQVVPELNVSCLRLALSTPKVTEQLLKLDEQGLSQKHKVGVLLCRAGQSTEEEMYNNEEASPAFSAFLELLGEQVLLKGFTKYAAQLDVKTDSTGTHSLYTTYQGYEVMFHVSTMLPYMPNNPQQLLRKRHIGNDIVTIIFQEPGALPFTPQNIRSHFQHVFVIVRVHNPCSENTCYSVAVTRMKDVPPFGPPIPSGVTFRDTETFRNFLLAKIINAENAAHKSEKFHTMATRTRQEYLRDLAENYVSGTPLDSAGKLNNLISLASKKRERSKAREGAELGAAGAIAWRVLAQDFSGGGTELPCALGLSAEYVLLTDCSTKEVVFNCFCADVIGWTPERLALKIFYGRGDHIAVRVPEGCAQDIREVVQRLKSLTVGCETVDMTLRRNGLGQLGFHVRLDGTVAEVEEYGFAWQAGLRQGSRLVEICKVAAVTLTHEQMIDLLRTSVTVKVVIIPPYEEGGPRRCVKVCVLYTQYSSHSSSNTLSSNASSSHSDERWFDGGAGGERGGGGCLPDPVDPDPDLLNKGGSNDSGIDASTHYNNVRHSNVTNNQSHKPMHSFATYSGMQELSVGRSSGGGEARRRESSPIIPASPRRTLQRTFSDESLCSGRREASFANSENQTTPTDLFTCTLPTLPLSASELSLTEVRDKVPPLRRLDPGLMPLPDTACGLEWSSLVNAAKAYEGEAGDTSRLGLFNLVMCAVFVDRDEVPNDLSGRLYHLEVMLKQLNNDLEREKQDKVVLLAEMANLRENNQRLQVESMTASEQLRKFSRIFTNLDKTENDTEAHSLTDETDSKRE
uniref:Signal-induced proliferation-associated 1 like 3 n=1 Tax=Dicentrarchus labrax TaxID=13489 RepID=A0A8P4G4G9_DICLA